MKKAIVRSATVLAMLTAASAPAVAQQQTSTGEGAPRPQEYVLREDGVLVVGGDGLVDCPSIASGVEQYGDAPVGNLDTEAELDEARETLALCEQYGFAGPSGGGVAAATPPPPPGTDNSGFTATEPNVPEKTTPTQQPFLYRTELPATGGPKPSLMVPLGGALFLTVLSVSGITAWRRSSGPKRKPCWK